MGLLSFILNSTQAYSVRSANWTVTYLYNKGRTPVPLNTLSHQKSISAANWRAESQVGVSLVLGKFSSLQFA